MAEQHNETAQRRCCSCWRLNRDGTHQHGCSLAERPDEPAAIRTNGDVRAKHGHADRPCNPPEAVRDVLPCRLAMSRPPGQGS